MRELNVLVADNHPIFAEGLQAVLSDPGKDYHFHIRGVANTGTEMRDLLYQNTPDLLLIDWSLPDSGALPLVPAVKKDHSSTRVLVMAPNRELEQKVFEAGADGFMLRSGTKDELLALIEQVIQGDSFWHNRRLERLEEKNSHPLQEFADKHGLTQREMEVLPLIGKAMDNHEIGSQLFISHQTVSVHRKNIMRKLRVNSTANLIKIAFENGLV